MRNARMGQCALRIALLVAAVLSLGSPPKASAEHRRAQEREQNAAPTAKANQHPPNAPDAQAKGCPGTDDPTFDCSAVSAKAAEDQVGQARRYARLFVIELVISALTAFGAIAAAGFAASAARSASKSYRAFVAAEDAFLFIEMPDGAIIESASADGERSQSYFLTAIVTNLGRSPARLHRYIVGNEVIPISKTLRHDEATTDGWRIQAESRDPFNIQIHYSTALRPEAVLTITAQVVDVANRHTRIAGAILRQKLRPEV